MKTPEISIVVPIYNAEQYLHRCVDSIIAQTFTDIQVILVDDGSTDLSPKICDEYSRIDDRVFVIHTPNRGVAAARNKGLEASQGKYIGFIDSDDYIEPDMFEKMHSIIVLESAQVCCCGFFIEKKENIYINCCKEVTIYKGIESILRAFYRQDCDSHIGNGTWNKLFRKDVIQNVRYQKYSHGEDVDFQCTIFRRCERVVCVPVPFYHYMCIDNYNSATNVAFSANYLGILRIADEQLDFVKGHFPDILEEVYAFHLTWYMSALQKMYEMDSRKIRKNCNGTQISNIRNVINENIRNYAKNSYVKRLDKYFMYALRYDCVREAIIFRNIIISLRKLVRR